MADREGEYRLKVTQEGADAFDQIAGGMDGARAAAEAAEPAIDRMAETAAEAPKEGIDSWREFQQLIKQVGPELSEALQTPDDLLDLGLARAKQDLEDYFAAIADGREEMSEMAVRTRVSLNQVKEATEELKQSGYGMTDAQEAELRQLEEAYLGASKEVGEFRRLQADVQSDLTRSADKAGDYRAGVGSIEDALASLNPTMARHVARAGAVTAGWAAGYSAGTKFLSLLKDLDRELGTNLHGSLNRTVQEMLFMQQAMDWLVGATPELGEEIREWNQIVMQLRAEGLEPVSDSLEEVRKQLEEYRRAQGEAAQATQEMTKRHREWLEGMNLSEDALREASSQLAENLGLFFQSAGDQVDYVQFAQDVLERYRSTFEGIKLTGIETPESVRLLMSELFGRAKEQAAAEAQELGGVLSEETEAALNGMLSMLDSLPESIKSQLILAAGHFGILPDALKTAVDGVEEQALRYENKIREMAGLLDKLEEPKVQLEALERALDNINPAELDYSLADQTEQQAQELRDELTKHIEAVREMGGEYTENIQALSTTLGLMIVPWGHIREEADGATEAVREHGQSSDELAESALNVQDSFEGLIHVSRSFQDQSKAAADQAKESKTAFDEQAEGAQSSAEGVEKTTQAMQDAAAAGDQAAEATQRIKDEQAELAESSADTIASLEESGGQVEAYAQKWSSAAEAVAGSAAAMQASVKGATSAINADLESVSQKLDSVLAKFELLRGSEESTSAPAPAQESVN